MVDAGPRPRRRLNAGQAARLALLSDAPRDESPPGASGGGLQSTSNGSVLEA